MALTKQQRRMIQNGSMFPLEVKAATMAEVHANPTKRRGAIAVERNMSSSTVARWAKAEGAPLFNAQHPKTAAGVKQRWAQYARDKRYVTPTLVTSDGQDCAVSKATHITFRGKLYKI